MPLTRRALTASLPLLALPAALAESQPDAILNVTFGANRQHRIRAHGGRVRGRFI